MHHCDQDPVQLEDDQPEASTPIGPVRVAADDIWTASIHRAPGFTSSKTLKKNQIFKGFAQHTGQNQKTPCIMDLDKLTWLNLLMIGLV